MAKKKKEVAVVEGPVREAYHLGQKDADIILGTLPKKHTDIHANVLRHRTKWLPSQNSVTTIPLAEDDYKVIVGLGIKLKKVM